MGRIKNPKINLIKNVEFWSKVKKTDGCWIWLGHIMNKGYGELYINKIAYLAHRISYIINKGDPGDFHVLHECDNRICIKPDHLFLGSNIDNVIDKCNKGRQSRGIHGAGMFTEDEIRVIRRRLATGECQTRIAEDFNCSNVTISDIFRKRSYGWIK